MTPLLTITRPTALTFETFCQYGISEYYDHYKVDVLNTSTGDWNTLWDAVDQPEWVNQFQEPVQLDLSAYQGQNIKLRWRAHSNGSDILTYSWFIDNVKVVATDTLSSVNENYLETKIYPNPVDNILNINTEEEIQSISIYNVLSVKVMEITINNKKAVIDLSDLESGLYFVEIIGKNEKSIKTFIKK